MLTAAAPAKPYMRFTAWTACHELTRALYRETRHWPADERYGLSAQARRAAFSAAVNIAEGSARRGPREFRRFLDVSVGSLTELSYILLLARDVELLSQASYAEIEARRDRASRLTWGLYRAIARKADRAG
jgi:four helix bundle protein